MNCHPELVSGTHCHSEPCVENCHPEFISGSNTLSF